MYMSDYDISSLNDEQKQALMQIDGVVLVTAGAGSGKTRLLTHRICYLIENGVSPYNILAITFTNKATNEMKERVSKMCDRGVWISTFHSMCVRILRENIEFLDGYTKNFTIIAENDRTKILKDLLKAHFCLDDELEKVEMHLDKIKNKGLDIEEYFSALQEYDRKSNLVTYQKICFEYENYLHKNNALDFDDLLNKTLFLFNNFKEVLFKYADRFHYILVDEFQDTNLVQYKLVKMLASVHKNLFVVGDEDQCIYSWRGAEVENISNLIKDFKDAKVFKLERNYRSTKYILDCANEEIKENRDRIKKKLWTMRENGIKPEYYEAPNERYEALFIVQKIVELISNPKNNLSYSDFAVLMRLNALTRPVEEALLACNIPYKVYGGMKFFDRAEIKIILAYLSIFVNPRDEISLFKIINFPKRGIGDVALSKLQEEAGDKMVLEYLLSNKFEFSKYHSKLAKFVENIKDLYAQMDTLSLFDFVQKVVKTFKIDEAFSGKDEEAINRLGNIDSFYASVQDFEKDNEDCSLSDYLSDAMLKSDNDDIKDVNAVSLATIHSVKGLEFKVVFIIGLEEGILPLKRKNNASKLEEERRLMYVAITRAEDMLFISRARERFMYGKSNYTTESSFLKELGIVDKKKPRVYGGDDFFKPETKEVFDSGFAVGDKVYLARYGEGKIVEVSDDGLVGKIDFEDFGIKEIMLNSKNLEKVEADNE